MYYIFKYGFAQGDFMNIRVSVIKPATGSFLKGYALMRTGFRHAGNFMPSDGRAEISMLHFGTTCHAHVFSERSASIKLSSRVGV